MRYAYKSPGMRLGAAVLDAFGALGRKISPFTVRTLPPAEIKKILLIRLDHLGDLIMTRPAMTALRRAFPAAQIDLLVAGEWRELFEGIPEINRVIPFDDHWFKRGSGARGGGGLSHLWKSMGEIARKLRPERYDAAVDFRGDLRNILLAVRAGIPYRIGYGITGGGFLLSRMGDYSWTRHQAHLSADLLRHFGISVPEPELLPFKASPERSALFWQGAGRELALRPHPWIILHPAAGAPSKEWPQDRYEEVMARASSAEPLQFVLIGTLGEKEKNPIKSPPGTLDLRGRTTLSDLAELFLKADLFLGHDSGPAHLAAAQGMTLLLLFSGTNDWQVWHPWTKRLKLMRHPVACSPCRSEVCPLGHHDCMRSISSRDVVLELRAMLETMRKY